MFKMHSLILENEKIWHRLHSRMTCTCSISCVLISVVRSRLSPFYLPRYDSNQFPTFGPPACHPTRMMIPVPSNVWYTQHRLWCVWVPRAFLLVLHRMYHCLFRFGMVQGIWALILTSDLAGCVSQQPNLQPDIEKRGDVFYWIASGFPSGSPEFALELAYVLPFFRLPDVLWPRRWEVQLVDGHL